MLVERILDSYVAHCHHKRIVFMILSSAMLHTTLCNFLLKNLFLVEINSLLFASLFIV